MPHRQKSVLVIPPKGARVRVVRFRIVVLVLLLLFFLAGFAGLFIPFSGPTLDSVEQNQKKNLAEQNQKLLQRIHGMRRQLHLLDGKLKKLETQRASIDRIAGIAWQGDTASEEDYGDLDVRHIDRLAEYVESTERLYARFADRAAGRESVFADIPVIAPVVDEHAVTAGFGEMRDPFTGRMKLHAGVDFAAKRETPVLATAAGTVTVVESHRRWGRRIRIRHKYGFTTVYAHLGTVKVARGRHVKRGDVIATVGISGLTTGPHLHYEIWREGKPVDPMRYIFPEIKVASSRDNA
ncbi:MAG: peptidoglycan DD-metalloendopeptidase family protein, partial [Chitinivibrionales bacterium]|nr:peptidoglycan DD-metalloendopeptidase family protein [Chitinivibrionales bacterium]MBD3395354.1 peptidoglycan DD-metalloendopeptidase family protein [Chitinivibrionales bacterium]